jgi:hypothetical protein
LNDTLPHENARWRWERGGWLLVNRSTGKVLQISLPEFDPYSSAAGWFRDYVAYCGISDDGKKASAIIVQLGRHKPLLKKPMGTAGAIPECSVPIWQRAPLRVTFDLKSAQEFTFTVPKPGRWTWFQKKKTQEKNKKTHGPSEPGAACNAARRTT